ncbi:hypothetical protein [Skermania piniformis]|uniref:Secreted protein n=1 Tax=Skermania pinensis TaxID=39122 RepID=A0ABX8SGC8_9ACTN|nr:hypothetical protein [Skermania piniformis]QXQ14731.1 hypothetical protein KV203_04845 [Skermania piniformis]
MHTSIKRFAFATTVTAFVGFGSLAGAGAAAADPVPLACTTTPVFGTGAFSTCGTDGWHRVHVTCWNWWPGGGWYERWGNPAWGQQQSWSSCDIPFTLRSWDITF